LVFNHVFISVVYGADTVLFLSLPFCFASLENRCPYRLRPLDKNIRETKLLRRRSFKQIAKVRIKNSCNKFSVDTNWVTLAKIGGTNWDTGAKSIGTKLGIPKKIIGTNLGTPIY